MLCVKCVYRWVSKHPSRSAVLLAALRVNLLLLAVCSRHYRVSVWITTRVRLVILFSFSFSVYLYGITVLSYLTTGSQHIDGPRPNWQPAIYIIYHVLSFFLSFYVFFLLCSFFLLYCVVCVCHISLKGN